MAEVLKGSVGLGVKGGPKPANNVEDVELVRRMLVANGESKLSPTGGIGPDVYRAIQNVARKAGVQMEVALVEPNSPLMKAMKPKYEQAKKKGGAAGQKDDKAKGTGGGTAEKKVDIMRVTLKSGGTLEMTVPAFKKLQAKVVASLTKYVKTLAKNHWDNVRTVDEYRDALHVHNGMMKAFTHNAIKVTGIVAKTVKYPDKAREDAASSAIKALVSAHASGDLAAIKTALPAAEKAANAYSADLEQFLKGFTGTARGIATGLQVTSAAGFAAVTVMAAPLLVPAGLTASQAVVATNLAVSQISTLAENLGKVSSGEKVTLLQLGKEMTVNGVVATFTGAVGEYVPPKWFDAAGKAFGQKLASTGLGRAMGSKATDYAAKYVAGAGLEGVKSAMTATVAAYGKSLKEGKKVDIAEIFIDIAVGTLTGGLMKNIDQANDLAYKKMRHQLEVKILPERFAKAGAKNVLDQKTMIKTLKEIDNKLQEELIKGSMKYWMENATGKETPLKLAELGAKALDTDARLQKLLDDKVKEIVVEAAKGGGKKKG